MHVTGVGLFLRYSDYWQSNPEQLAGSVLNIESTAISVEQQNRSRYICLNWADIVSQCLAYIETRRQDYGLETKSFVDPGVFVNSGQEWSVYFDTDHEFEAVVGVEFRDDEPFQLIIGD